MKGGATKHTMPQIVSVQEVRGASVKVGRFTREPVFVVGYDDGRYVVGYPLRIGSSFVVVPLADVPWPDPA